MLKAKYNPKTTEECKQLFLDAEEISLQAASALKDGLQGKALLQAKKNLCGEDWNLRQLSKGSREKWSSFLREIDCWNEKVGSQNRNVSYLLDFAGYKEEGGVIETASHYREAKKIAGPNTGDIDETYKNVGGSENKTAAQLRANLTKKKVYVQDIFIREVGHKPEPSMNQIQIGSKMLDKLPHMTENEWKTWYRTASRCMHPDHGGSEHDFSILNSLNEMITTVVENEKRRVVYNEWAEDFKQWKKDHNYTSDFIEE